MGRNPDVPDWARESYQNALRELGRLGLEELPRSRDPQAVQSILGLLAIVHGARTYGRILSELTEDEVLELEKMASGEDAAECGVEPDDSTARGLTPQR